MLTLQDILACVALPSAIAVVAALVFWLKRRPLAFVGSLVVAIAFFAAQVALDRKSALTFPPVESQNWVFPIALALGVLGAINAAVLPRWWLRLPVVAVAVAGTAYVIALPMIRRHWSPAETAAYVGGTAAAATLAWLSLDVLAARKSPGPRLAALAMVCGLTLVMMLSGSMSIGKSCMALSSAVWAIGILAGRREKAAERVRGLLPVAAALTAVLTFTGLESVGYAEINYPNAALLLFPAFTVWLAEIPPFARWPKTRFALALVLAFAPIAAAGARAQIQFNRDNSAMYGE